MRILLDEDFPLPLYRRLLAAGYEVEHIIVLGQRGMPDSQILARLRSEALLFLTQDKDFFTFGGDLRSVIVLSRLAQSIPIAVRVEIWSQALVVFLEDVPEGRLFELSPEGDILPR